MDRIVYKKHREFKLFNIKIAELIDRYDECSNYDVVSYNPIMERPIDLSQDETKKNRE